MEGNFSKKKDKRILNVLKIALFSAILFVYDVTNQQSFDDIEDWMKVAKKVLASAQESKPSQESEDSTGDKPTETVVSPTANTHFALVGNKTDLQHMIAVKPDQHEKFAAEIAMSSHLVCASRADGIELMIIKVGCSYNSSQLRQYLQDFSQKPSDRIMYSA